MTELQELNEKLDKLIEKVEHLDRKNSSIGKTLTMLIDNINGYQKEIVSTNLLWRNYLKERLGLSDKQMPTQMGLREQILELYNKDISVSAIAKILGVSRTTIYKHLER